MAIVAMKDGVPVAVFTGDGAQRARDKLMEDQPGIYTFIASVSHYKDLVPVGAMLNPIHRIHQPARRDPVPKPEVKTNPPSNKPQRRIIED